MSLAARLGAAGFVAPDYGRRDLGAVLPAVMDAVGVGGAVVGRDGAADRARLGLPEASHVVVALLDGLGLEQLEARRGHAPFLRSAAHGELTAGYPSTTASSLAMLGTGAPAGKTGMAGYTVRNPETGTIANLVSWDGAGDPLEWQTQPSLFEAAQGAGVHVTTLGKKRFAGSGLTRAALRGGEFVGAESLAERVDVAVARSRTPGITYCYWSEIDTAGHTYGWNSENWVACLEEADTELRRLARSLPSSAVLVVTADHGMVDVTGAPRWDVATDPVLHADVPLTAGEPRALHVHVEEGADPEVVAQRWQHHLGDNAVVMNRSEAVSEHLFGPVDDAVVERLGDVVVAMTGRATVVDSRTQTPKSLELIGVHGSLTPAELRIPLLLASR